MQRRKNVKGSVVKYRHYCGASWRLLRRLIVTLGGSGLSFSSSVCRHHGLSRSNLSYALLILIKTNQTALGSLSRRIPLTENLWSYLTVKIGEMWRPPRLPYDLSIPRLHGLREARRGMWIERYLRYSRPHIKELFSHYGQNHGHCWMIESGRTRN